MVYGYTMIWDGKEIKNYVNGELWSFTAEDCVNYLRMKRYESYGGK